MIENPLYFSKAERRMILLWIFIAMATIAMPWPEKQHDIRWEMMPLAAGDVHVPFDSTSTDTAFMETFCPDKPASAFSQEEWERMGAAPWIAERLIKYQKAGGQIKRPDDLLRIYGIDTAWVYRVQHCVTWEEAKPWTRKPGTGPAQGQNTGTSPRQKQLVQVEVNTATAEEFARLYGIGPVLSERIVKFREKLGGFHDIQQIGETYGLEDSVFQGIRDKLVLRAGPDKIEINRADERTLARHPYISWRDARTIVRYRTHHGPFKDTLDLLKIQAVDSEKRKMWLPYVRFAQPPPDSTGVDSSATLRSSLH
jgi:competence protein ComEA